MSNFGNLALAFTFRNAGSQTDSWRVPTGRVRLDGVNFESVPRGQEGFQQALMMHDQPTAALRTEWGQGQAPSGLGQVAAQADRFVHQNGDVGPNQLGFEKDGWHPLYNEKWVQQRQKDMMLELATQTPACQREYLLWFSTGVNYVHPGRPYVLNWQRQPAAHPLHETRQEEGEWGRKYA